MIARHWNDRLIRLSIFAAVAAVGVLAARPAAAADLAKLDTSLKLIPADAAFYSSMLRNREQFEAIKNSNAWAKIMEMPVVQMGLFLYNAQVETPDSGPAQVGSRPEQPRNPQDHRSGGRHGFGRGLRLWRQGLY